MQAIHLYLFFLTTCGFAQETSLLDSEDNILLDVRKLPSALPSAPNAEDDDISANVEDLQRELIAERAKNRDLNQTISDILEEMEDMKNMMVLLTKDVEDLQEEVDGVQGDVAAVQDDVVAVAEDVERNSADITRLATMGTWCATKKEWYTVGTITYDSITYSDSNNMNIAATPLDINTGITHHRVKSTTNYESNSCPIICQLWAIIT